MSTITTLSAIWSGILNGFASHHLRRRFRGRRTSYHPQAPTPAFPRVFQSHHQSHETTPQHGMSSATVATLPALAIFILPRSLQPVQAGRHGHRTPSPSSTSTTPQARADGDPANIELELQPRAVESATRLSQTSLLGCIGDVQRRAVRARVQVILPRTRDQAGNGRSATCATWAWAFRLRLLATVEKETKSAVVSSVAFGNCACYDGTVQTPTKRGGVSPRDG